MNLAERIDDFLEERANAEIDWDDQVSAFRDFVEMELQEQREACVMSVRSGRHEYWSKYYASPPESFIDECIRNARVEKSDEF